MPKPPPKINIFEAGKNFGGQGFNEIQKHPGRCKITGRFHKERADMLVDAGKHKIMLVQNPENLIKVIRRNAGTLLFLPAVITFSLWPAPMPGLMRIMALPPLFRLAKNIQLGQGIDAFVKAAFGHGRGHFIRRDIVCYIQKVFCRLIAGQLIHVKVRPGSFASAISPSGADNGQQDRIGIGLDRIVYAKPE